MTTTVSREPTSASGPEPTLSDPARKLGLTSATALVVGSIIGTGVFTMPAVMAGAGTSSILTLVAISIGAILLGSCSGSSPGGCPTTRAGSTPTPATSSATSPATSLRGATGSPAGPGTPPSSRRGSSTSRSSSASTTHLPGSNFGIALTGLWIPAAINLVGVRQMAFFQNITVVLKFLPLLLVGTLGWFFVKTANFGAVQRLGRQPLRRGQHGRRGRPVLLHRGRVRIDRRRSGQGPPAQRRSGLGHRDRRERAALRGRDGRGHGPRPPRQAGR